MFAGRARLTASVVAACLVGVLAGCDSAAPPTPTLLTPAIVHNIPCDTSEHLAFHIHAHLTVLNGSNPVTVPAGIGLNGFPATTCFYWLHTHTPDGIIHVEAPQTMVFTLGDFFAVWSQTSGSFHGLDSKSLAGVSLPAGSAIVAYVNGKKFDSDPNLIQLGSHTDIVVEITPPDAVPNPYLFPPGN